MNNATNTQQPPVKRTRFEPRDTTDETTTSPPKQNALQFIKSSTASLLPTIANICERLGKEHIALLSQLDNKKQKVQQMNNDPTFTPNSARLNFEHSVSKRVAKSTEYDELKEKTSDYLIEVREKLKALVLAAVRLEVQYLQIEIQEHLATSLRIITESFMIKSRDTSDVDTKAKYIINTYSNRLSIHAPMSKANFVTLYNTIHAIDDITANNDAMNDNDATDGSLYEHITGNALVIHQPNANNLAAAPAGVNDIIECFEAVFVSSWTQYKTQKEMNLVTLDLKKLSTRVFTTRTTAAAVAPVDDEPAADKHELKALIRHEAKADNKEIQKQLDSLKKQLENIRSAKNMSQRGRGGASKKEPNTPSKAATKPPSKTKETTKNVSRRDNNKNNQRKGKVEENNNGNANVKKHSKVKSGKPSSNTNKRNSSNANKTTKNRSSKK